MAVDAEVELNAAGAPRAAPRDVSELDDVVEVYEVTPRLLVHRAPYLAADLGKDGHFDLVVLKDDRLPLARRVRGARAVEEEVRVTHLARGGHGIGIKEGISRELDLGFSDRGRAAG